MMRSMFSGVSGLRIHQTMMDIIGNNIANINTVGYKSSNLTFQSMLSQTLKGASTPAGDKGGSNPIQVGLGAQIGSVDSNFAQGNLQSTGKVSDMAIQGDGFFILKSNAGVYYTRAGNFIFDSNGNLVNPADGMIVQGWIADTGGNVNTSNSIGSINIPLDQIIEPTSTSVVNYGGNLPSESITADKFVTSIDIIDSQGSEHTMTVTFTKLAESVGPPAVLANTWKWEVTGPTEATGSGTVVFGADGILSDSTGGPVTFTPSGADAMSINLNFGTVGKINGLTQFSTSATVAATSQDGNGPGALQSLSIGSKGEITGIFSNGQTRTLAQIALALFKNPSGLIQNGNNLYSKSNNSGVAIFGESDSGGRGQIIAGTLEMSNVDLAKEFANMIIAQRGFQANSKIITASDEMLGDLVNLKR
jgi:flagellar hook protein FlgE